MGNIFSGSEVIELGIQIEKNGRDFYSTLAANSKTESNRGVFLKLAGEEEKHIAVFQGMLEKISSNEVSQPYSDEYNAYMQALVSEAVFTQKEQGRQIASRVKSPMPTFLLVMAVATV